MSRLNKPIPPPKFEGDPYQKAEELMDKLFLFFHDYESLNLQGIIIKSNLTQAEKVIAAHLSDKIEILLFDKYGYAEKTSANAFYGYLTSKGRDAKAVGGHFKYLKKLNDDKEIERDKNEYDLEVKKWTYKSRYVPYIISFIAVVISLLTYLNNRSKDSSNTELKNRQTILEKKLDTLSQKLNEINLIKKDSQLIKQLTSDTSNQYRKPI